MSVYSTSMFDEKTPLLTSFFAPLFTIFKRWKVWILVGVLAFGVMTLGWGGYFLVKASNETLLCPQESKKTKVETSSSVDGRSSLYVDVAGEVKKPGVYGLDNGARLEAAISAAGGFTDTADSRIISQEFNLAQKVNDGDKFYIPSKEESVFEQEMAEFCQHWPQSAAQLENTGKGNSNGGGGQTTGVSINTATKEELETLEGIGEKRAADIIANRPFSNLSELLEKEVLSENLFENIKGLVKL